MHAYLHCLSHTPLVGFVDPEQAVLDEVNRVIADARAQGRKGLVLTCKEALVHYYAKFGFVNEGVSGSTHGGVVWYQMRLKF
mgnify:CR=1 FL=1